MEDNPRNAENAWTERRVRNAPLATHEIDAVIGTLTAALHLKNQTEQIGDEEKGYIIVSEKRNWRTLTA